MIMVEIGPGPIARIPDSHELVVFEKGGDPMDGYVLYGFDEIGMFEAEFDVPAYAFVEV